MKLFFESFDGLLLHDAVTLKPASTLKNFLGRSLLSHSLPTSFIFVLLVCSYLYFYNARGDY